MKTLVVKTKKEIKPLAIATLILGGFIGGLLVLCMDESDFSDNSAIKYETASKQVNAESLEKNLQKLKELRDNGTLSEEEYAEARKKAIDKSI